MPLQETSGAASYDAFGGGPPFEPVYIESVFSTWLYTGNGSTQTITNGIDLSTKGGLVWLKYRSGSTGSTYHHVYDSARGKSGFSSYNYLYPNDTSAQGSGSSGPTSFNSDGFSLNSYLNASTIPYVSWTFRKQAKFFDVVTYTGNGTAGRTVAHSLGSVPGCIIVKQTSASGQGWAVYHRSEGQGRALLLNDTAASFLASGYWNSTAPTDTVFTLGSSATVNGSGSTYVAYLFAHDAGGFGLTGTDNVISCGSFTGTGSTVTVNLGYEPQWLMFKRTDDIGDWITIDNMRGWTTAGADAYLRPNTSGAEASITGGPALNATGFSWAPGAGTNFIYIAIRRGPMKTPTTGTSVFETLLDTAGTGTLQTSTASFPLDMQFNTLYSQTNATYNNQINDRLRGIGFAPSFTTTPHLTTATTDAETTASSYLAFKGNGRDVTKDSGWGSTVKALFYNFRRAPGFFDVVCYTGTGSATTQAHNLGVVPEMIIIKSRTQSLNWTVYTATTGTGKGIYLNSTSAEVTFSQWVTSTSSTTFGLGTGTNVNGSGDTFVAYLFASCPGVSKVFSFTGNGSSQTINCGFTGGARFVMIKRTDSTGDWYVWDTARGIVANNDPHLSLNSTAAEVTTNDTIDTDSTGFVVNQVSATNVNVNGASYIGLAIA